MESFNTFDTVTLDNALHPDLLHCIAQCGIGIMHKFPAYKKLLCKYPEIPLKLYSLKVRKYNILKYPV